MSRTPLVHLDGSLAGADVGDRVPLSEAEHHHLGAVLRLRDGDPVEISDGAGRLAAGELAGASVALTSAVVWHPAPAPLLRVAHALPKGRKLDEAVRACVELGMDALVPVTAERSVRRPEGGRADKAVRRWASVARAACEQSRRVHRPTIEPVTGVEDLRPRGVWLLAHPEARTSLPEALPTPMDGTNGDASDAVTVAVGPEGGWTDAEVSSLTARGARAVHLGPSVLRTEHAAAAALAVMGALTGRWTP